MNSSAAENSSGAACEFTQNLEILRRIDFFAGLPIETLKLFAYLCERETFGAGDFLFVQDEDDGQALYIITGQALLVHMGEAGELQARTLGPGEFLGGLSLLGNMPRLFSLKATEEVACLVLTREKFAKAIAQFPDLIPRLYKSVVEGIRSWEKHCLFELKEKGLSLEGLTGISAL